MGSVCGNIHWDAQLPSNIYTIAATGKKDIAMNYNNYKTAVVETYAIHLIGWPQGIKFTSPSNIGTVGEIHKLHNALKTQMCYWAGLTPTEVKAHTATLDAWCSAGEVVWQPCKKRSDAGISCKRKAPHTMGRANKENNRPSKKLKKSSESAPKSAEFIDSSDKEDDVK